MKNIIDLFRSGVASTDRLTETLLGAVLLLVVMVGGQTYNNHVLLQENKQQAEVIAQKDERIASLEQEKKTHLAQIRNGARTRTEMRQGIAVMTERLSEANSERRKIENYLSTKYNLGSRKASVLAGYFYDARERAKERYGVDVDVSVLVALSHTESRFIYDAVSPAGAMGIMQVMPKYHLDRYDFLQEVTDLFVPELNIRAGVFIFAEELKKYGSVRKAIRAYHGGRRGVFNPRPTTVSYENEIYRRLAELSV